MSSDPKRTDGRPVHLLFVLPSLGSGGAEAQTVDLVNGLSPENCQTHLLCFDAGLALRERVDPKVVQFHSVLRRAKFDLMVPRFIAHVIDEQEIDVVHCSLMIALFWGWLGIRLSHRKPKLVAAIHTTLNSTLRAEVLDWALYRWLLQSCERVIFVCRAQRGHWCKKFPSLRRLAVVVYNGIDAERFRRESVAGEARDLREALGPGNSRIITHVAAFRPEKGHAILLQAYRQVLKCRDNVRLVFAGDGPLRPAIEQQVRESGLVNQVLFLGSLPDVRPILAVTDVTVLPSTAETFSMAMLESLSMEVPVVAADLGGVGEAVIDGQTGYLVPPRDTAALAAAILRCLDDDGNRIEMGRRGRALVVDRFRRDKMIEETQTLLLEVALGD